MVSKSAVRGLAELAAGFREAAGDAWPNGCAAAVVLLADVVAVLGGDAAQVEAVLGPEAAAFVAQAAEAPV